MSIADQISERLDEHEKKHGHASLVVCGGKSPISIFNELSKKPINWKNITITLADDRLVPYTHKDSNQLLIKKHLLKNDASKAIFIPLQQKITNVQIIKRPFTITLISVGSDGHFASLFSNMLSYPSAFDINANPDVLLIAPNGVPKLPRITMNLSMILQSKLVILLALGKQKEKLINTAQIDKSIPINRLICQKRTKIQIEVK